jgi:hypothetical protein
MNSRLVIGTGFTSTATRCSVLRPDLGRSISQAIKAGRRIILVCAGTSDLGKRPVANAFLSKKKLAMAFHFRHTSRSCGDYKSS